MPTTVNITWQEGAAYNAGSSFEAGVTGVYVIYSKDKWRRGATKGSGSSDIVYIGEGDVGTRLSAHASASSSEGNPEVRKLLEAGEGLAFKYAVTTKRQAQCLEAALLADFEANYGSLPLGNQQGGSCGVTGDYRFTETYDIIEAHHNAGK